MAEVTLNINGRNYGITCDDGQEQRVIDLGAYVDQRMREIAGAGAATNDSHLLVLTALMLSDEVFDLRDGATPEPAAQNTVQTNGEALSNEDEAAIAGAIDGLAERINNIADRLQEA